MKFDSEVEINLPVSRVVELFDNPNNVKFWQPEQVSFELISGTQGQPGAKTRLKYLMGKREVDIIETITVRNLPYELSASYEAKGIYHEGKNYFTPLGGHKTLYKTTNSYEMTGFWKLMGILMPWYFKKESMKYMLRFKEFAEKQG